MSDLPYAVPWKTPNYASPDLFDPCGSISPDQNSFGSQLPFEGVAYSGIIVYDTIPWREYIQVELTESLVAEQDYCLSFYVSLGDSSNYYLNSIGAYFSVEEIYQTNVFNMPYIPQIINNQSVQLDNRTEWTLIEGEYTSIGGERFLTIGNFLSDSEVEQFYISGGGDPINYPKAYYYIDQVSVTLCSTLSDYPIDYSINLSVYPNPASEYLKITGLDHESLNKMSLLDLNGRILLEEDALFTNKHILNISGIEPGTYLIRVISHDKTVIQKLRIN
jgi:hypothetical protein